jgi:hypothetical protein
MNTHTINTYFFNELNETATKTALDDHRYFLGNYGWWEDTILDAKTVFGINIKSFDFERGQKIDIEFMDNLENIANKIIEEWGPDTALNKDAHCYLESRQKNHAEAPKDKNGDVLDSELLEEQLDENDNAFKDYIGQTYLNMLEKEFEWLISDECIGDHLQGMEYEFLENGKRFKYNKQLN